MRNDMNKRSAVRVTEQAIASINRKKVRAETSGFALIELMIVLALTGLAATLAGVSLSSGDAKLRSFARDMRFNLEKAKQEALSRNLPVTVEFFNSTPSFDCNGDGDVNEKDRCYVLYLDEDGVDGFDPAMDQQIKAQSILPATTLAGNARLEFSPFGGSQAAGLDITTSIRTDYRNCATRCLTVKYPLTLNHVGRILIGEKEETCADCTLCGSCS